MNTMQLPSRVCDVLAALRTQGFDVKFSPFADGDIGVEVYRKDEYKTSFFLRHEIDFDMYNCEYEKMCDVLDPRVQKKSAAVLKYLEGIINY